MLVLEISDPREAGAKQLLETSHALMADLFPPEENFALDIEDLCTPDIYFFIAREGSEVLGTGAVAQRDGYGEVKSMFTSANARGKGVAAALLRQLEDQARTLGLSALKLETGEALAAAIRLYERHGFTRCGAFGDYQPNQSSVFMEKQLDALDT